MVEHPERGVRASRRGRVVLDRRVLHVDPVPLAVAEHDLDLVAVLLAVGDHVVVLDPLVREDGDHPADQPPPEERHRALGAQVARSLEGQRAGSDALSSGETDADDFGHPEHGLILGGEPPAAEPAPNR